jgi:hypothetical protein
MNDCKGCGGTGKGNPLYGGNNYSPCPSCNGTGKEELDEAKLSADERKEICPQCKEQTSNCLKDCLMFERIEAIFAQRIALKVQEIKDSESAEGFYLKL